MAARQRLVPSHDEPFLFPLHDVRLANFAELIGAVRKNAGRAALKWLGRKVRRQSELEEERLRVQKRVPAYNVVAGEFKND